ncbi:acyltransferase family protein [Arvimicrobium flavum]|uniref:acyltransferase family protein n=1 Tax=Arvimicrobium flavum TaxID=3393320 RepID=UPI00237B84F3|nr:acyltransferase [Mesorhizobium shangrilense]
MQARNSLDRIATLDLLRLVAALAVVAYHYLFRGAAADGYLDVAFPAAAPFAIYGYLGVNLFFLISGFVIAWSAEGRSWQAFAVARFARLYPGFLVCMVLTWAVLAAANHPAMPVSTRQLVANLIILSPALGEPFVDGVYWSIVLEIVFYGWVTLAILAGVFSRLKLELVTAWLAICALNEFYLGSGALRLLFITEYGPLFAGGILVHHIFSRGRSPEAMMLLGASFMLSCSMLVVARGWMQQHYGVAAPLLGLVAANIAIHALLVAAIVLRDRVASTATVLALGSLTYPLYLLHQNIGYVAIGSLAPKLGAWTAALATLLVMLLLSWAVWRFVERPVRRGLLAALGPLADRLAGRIRKRIPRLAVD